MFIPFNDHVNLLGVKVVEVSFGNDDFKYANIRIQNICICLSRFCVSM